MIGIADETDIALLQVFNTVIIVKNVAFFVGVNGVDGQVAARSVGFPVGRKFDDGMSPVGFNVAAQRRHFKHFVINNDSDSAEFNADGNGAQTVF